MEKTITWSEFYESFIVLKESVPSYRLGQHFMNMFIMDRSELTCDEVCKGLWGKTGDEAVLQCYQVINKYQWSTQKLPLL